MPTPKTPPATIDAYIAGCPPEIQARLRLLRRTIRQVAPQAVEAIKYKMPTFVLHGNLVYFSTWKHHIGFYPITAAMMREFPELAEYPTSGRGTIQFPHARPLPVALIRKLVAARVKENTRNKK